MKRQIRDWLRFFEFVLIVSILIFGFNTGSMKTAFGQPTQIIDGGLCYFPPLQSLITVGGWGTNTNWEPLQTVWAYKNGMWSSLPDIPTKITHTAMTYDPSRQQLVVVGGVFSDQSTWGFDGTTWQKIADPIEEISLGGDPEIIYDPEIQSLVMYYANANSESSDTYLLQSGVWSKQTLTTQPPGAMDSAFLYDPSRKEGIWFEGNETWTWNHTQWIQKNPTNRPEMEWGYFNMAFDTIHNEAILFGNGQTWSWNGEEWTRLQPIESPTNPERGFFAMGFDESRDAVVLWGGELLLSMSPYQTSYLDDIWEWDGTTWQQRSSTAIVNWKSY